MRALVAAGARAARSWACVGCDARGAGEGVALVGFVDAVEDCEGRDEVVREGAMVVCVCAPNYILSSLASRRASSARCTSLSRVDSCKTEGVSMLVSCVGPLVSSRGL